MSGERLNAYGDQLIRTGGAHGADIASQRIDELDRLALVRVLECWEKPPTCADIGCGSGWQGLRLAALGSNVHLYDQEPEPPTPKYLRESSPLSLTYHQVDLRILTNELLPDRIDLAFSQRFIHYLRFGEALEVVRMVASRMPPMAYFFLSASGLGSELGCGYQGCEAADPDHRFGYLSEANMKHHGIAQPVCLYAEQDLARLMSSAGFAVDRIWSSRFGNVKGVFKKSV